MKTLSELVEIGDPAWPLVEAWCRKASNETRILPASRGAGEQALLGLQVTSRSPLGAIALETGGILVDGGWVRVLGSAEEEMKEGLVEWNRLQDDNESARTLPNARLIGHDVTGGFFAVNGGKWPGDLGGIYYWGQDTLDWTDLRATYSGWLQWLFTGDLDRFYESLRWPGWREDTAALLPDQGISIQPFPWASEGGPIASRNRRTVPMRELWEVSNEIARQLRDVPAGSQVEIRIDK